MSKCQIQWIDSQGNATPDNNDAIALVQAMGYQSTRDDGSVYTAEPSEVYACCSEHLKHMEAFKPRLIGGKDNCLDFGWRIVEDIRANTRD